MAPVAILAAIVMLFAGLAVVAMDSEAKTFPDQGISEDLQGTTIEIAPGFQYTYTIKFDETLNEGVTVDDVVNTLPEGCTTDIQKNVSGEVWGTLKVVIDEDTPATTYDLVLKAEHAESGQVAYQYIIFDVKSGVTVAPTDINLKLAVQNQTFSQEFTVTAGYGNIQSITVSTEAFDVSGQQPTADGTSSTATFTISGTPTTIGAKTITISGTTTHNEQFSKTYEFQVYSEFTGAFDAQTITSLDGSAKSSTQQTVPSDLTVTWKADAELPEGVTLNESTGVVTVESDDYINATVALTATDSITKQTKTMSVTVQNENVNAAIQVQENEYVMDDTYYTYVDAGARTLAVAPTLVASTTFSGIQTWSVEGSDLVTMDN